MNLSVLPVISELNRRGCNIVLGSQLQDHETVDHEAESHDTEDHETVYHDTVLPRPENRPLPLMSEVPGKIREMRSLYEYGRESLESRARNFYKQAVFMEDYEDDIKDLSCICDFQCYYPTYHDLKNEQLRAYFTWRTHVRKGEYQKVADSAAYIYIYELLNTVGGSSPEECLNKMKAFEHGYLDQGLGSTSMRKNLRRWMLEYAVIHNMTPEEIRQAADPEMIRRDESISVLKEPDRHSDEEVLAALRFFGAGKIEKSPVITRDHERGAHLMSEIWRSIYSEKIEDRNKVDSQSTDDWDLINNQNTDGWDLFVSQNSNDRDLSNSQSSDGRDMFSLCFGKKAEHRWYPLSNAVCIESVRPDYRGLIYDGSSHMNWGTAELKPAAERKTVAELKQTSAAFGHLDDREVILDESRRYFIKDGVWHVEAYEKLYFDRARMLGLLRRADEKLRRYLNTGRYLKEDPAGKWADPYIDAVIESDRVAQIEAARPKITIDLSGLDKIREDAVKTRDSLLIDDETGNSAANESMLGDPPAVELDIPLDDTEKQIGAVELDIPLDDTEKQIGAVELDIPLDETEIQIVRVLLDGGDPSDILKTCRIMPSIAADQISEKLFDEIGDNVIVCEDGKLEIVEDYLDDVRQLVERR